ncbi:MAG: peptide ABC transporter substrate-binding protein, partial [Alphaproteobacteria bacterium]|nr:peptide ABC transporter substrate-binding protein [Alphaproteobacteria bacterium]
MAVGRRIALALALVLGVATAAQAQMVYHRGNTAEPETLDQHLTSTVYEAHILRDLYESLVVHGPEAEIRPGAAASWTVSDDGRVYTFEIREDATWSNGDDLTARDFVFSYRRILDPATGAKYANILYPIAGAEAVNKGEAAPETIGVRAVDTKILEI